MNIYQHIAYNPQITNIIEIINKAQKKSEEWRFCGSQPITDIEHRLTDLLDGIRI